MSKDQNYEDLPSQKVGGIAFYASLLAILILTPLLVLTGLPLVLDAPRERIFPSVAGFFCGLISAYIFSPRRFLVFIHELKHSAVSGLAGNRPKGMHVAEEEGHFRYEYTKRTAHLNALITLAPYWFPLFLLIGLPLAFLFLPYQSIAAGAVAAALFGIDLRMNVRDMSPYQWDFQEIRGGFSVGLAFSVCMNIAIAVFTFSYALLGPWGPWEVLEAIWRRAMTIVTVLGEA